MNYVPFFNKKMKNLLNYGQWNSVSMMKMNTVKDEESEWIQSVTNTLSDNEITFNHSTQFSLNIAINNSDIQDIRLVFLDGSHLPQRTVRIIIETYHNMFVHDEFIAYGWVIYDYSNILAVYKDIVCKHVNDVLKEIQQLESGINIKG